KSSELRLRWGRRRGNCAHCAGPRGRRGAGSNEPQTKGAVGMASKKNTKKTSAKALPGDRPPKKPRPRKAPQTAAAATPPATPPPAAAPTGKKLSALDAAALVLAEADTAMNCPQLIAAMAETGYWTSPAGKTPAATLYAAILKEIRTKGAQARFQKTGRGQFART